jgi:hypothetical protein
MSADLVHSVSWLNPKLPSDHHGTYMYLDKKTEIPHFPEPFDLMVLDRDEEITFLTVNVAKRFFRTPHKQAILVQQYRNCTCD